MLTCVNCGRKFEPKNGRGRFCSDKCRAAAWQAGRKREPTLVEEQLTRALTRVRALRGSKAEA